MGMGLSGGAPEPSQTLLAQNEQSFVCNICRKSFKREMNLIFHMTTHRQRQTVEGVGEIQHSNAPVKCSDCDKVFATKYQAKKHFLRRHFKGDRPYKCRKCNKKSFTVKEDLTMHMKACGQVFSCSCGIRLCSLGALKRHAKYFEHTPSSWDGLPVANGTGAGEFGGGLDEHGKEAGGGMEDDMDDSDDEGVLLPPATQGGVGGVGGNGGGGGASGGGGEASHRGLMIGVDMADGAAAQALLMADQQSRTHRFEPAAGGALAQGLQGLWQTQQQLGQLGGGGLQLGDSELMRQHMQTHALLSQQVRARPSSARALPSLRPRATLTASPTARFPPCSRRSLRAQQFQHIMAEQLQAHPQMAAHYNNATLQVRARVHAAAQQRSEPRGRGAGAAATGRGREPTSHGSEPSERAGQWLGSCARERELGALGPGRFVRSPRHAPTCTPARARPLCSPARGSLTRPAPPRPSRILARTPTRACSTRCSTRSTRPTVYRPA
jgi:hypothetical protein